MLSKIYKSAENDKLYIVVGLTHDELLKLGSIDDQIVTFDDDEHKVAMAIVSGETNEDLYKEFLNLIGPKEGG